MMRDFVDDNVRTCAWRRVPGVSQVQVCGGAERQVQISVDPAAWRSAASTVARRARRRSASRNRDVSGGEIESGKRRYLLRTIGRFERRGGAGATWCWRAAATPWCAWATWRGATSTTSRSSDRVLP